MLGTRVYFILVNKLLFISIMMVSAHNNGLPIIESIHICCRKYRKELI